MQPEMRTAQARRSLPPAPSAWMAPQDARNLRTRTAIPERTADSRSSSRGARVEWPSVDEQGTAHHLRNRTSLPEVSEAPTDPFVADEFVADEGARACIVGELYKAYYHRVFCFTRRFVRDEEAEEVAHEAFVRLFRVRNLERMTISVAYLLRIAENLLKRRHERALRYRQVLEQSGFVSGLHGTGEHRGESAGKSSAGHQARFDLLVDSAQLATVLGQLTREEQAAVRLIVCEGLDYQAAARSLGVPVSTINNWKHRGLSKLKELIGRSRARTSGDEPLAAG